MPQKLNHSETNSLRNFAAPNRRVRRSLQARYACTFPIKEQAYRIRYEGYLAHGYIDANPRGILYDHFDDEYHAPSVVIYDNGKAVGTVRLCNFDSTQSTSVIDKLPSAELFELTAEKIRTRFCENVSDVRAIEISKLAKIPECESDLGITMALFKMLKIVAIAMRTHVVFASVRVPHMSLYSRLGFRIVEEPRYFAKDNIVLGLMACQPDDFRSIQDRAERIFHGPKALGTNEIHETAATFFRGEIIDVFPHDSAENGADAERFREDQYHLEQHAA